DLLQFPVQVTLKARHGRGAGNVLAMDQHGCVEVAFGEHADDMLEVTANLLEAGGVFEVVGTDFDQSAVLRENEVMGSLLVGESHDLVAVLVDHGVMVLSLVILLTVGKT